MNDDLNDTPRNDTFRRAGRVVVGVTGSASSEAALRRAVAEARRSGRVLVPVLTWEPPGGEAAYRLAPDPSLTAFWQRQAIDRFDAAIDAALGGMPDDLAVSRVVAKANAAGALLQLADQPDDLLVLGAGPRHPLARLGRGAVRRRVLARAVAPVLLVGPAVITRADRDQLRALTPEDFLTRGLAC